MVSGWTDEEESLPYGGDEPNSGWAGSDTSRERAEEDDRSGTTRGRQHLTLLALQRAGVEGLTVVDVRGLLDVHHGKASNVLSTLHKEDRIARLAEKRGRCKIYVRHSYVNGRTTEPPGESSTTILLNDMATALRGFMPEGSHCPWHRAADPHDDCRFCVADQTLARYEARK